MTLNKLDKQFSVLNEGMQYERPQAALVGRADSTADIDENLAGDLIWVRIDGDDRRETPALNQEMRALKYNDKVWVMRNRKTGEIEVMRPDPERGERKREDYSVIVDWTELTSTASSISLTSIPDTHRVLKLHVRLRTDRASTVDNVLMRFNGSATSAQYDSIFANVIHSATLGTTEKLGTAPAGLYCCIATGASATTDYFGAAEITLFGYHDNDNFTMVTWTGGVQFGTSSGSIYTAHGAGQWVLGNTVTRIDLLPEVGFNFVADSAYMLAGIG